MKAIDLILAAAMAVSAPSMASAQSKPGQVYKPGESGGRPTVDLKVCNRSGRSATVAVSYVQVGESRFMNRGWYDVADGAW